MPRKRKRFGDGSGREDNYAYYGTASQRHWLAQNLDPLVQAEWITGVLYAAKFCLLHDAGADVPAPYTQIGHTILVEYLGDEEQPAPMLSRVRLSPGEAQPLYERLMVNVELMLACGRVHADLSPFNVLYWQGKCTIVDFSQAVDMYRHPSAFTLFHRDVDRLCRYFQQWGIECAPFTLATEIWGWYVRGPWSDRVFVEASSS